MKNLNLTFGEAIEALNDGKLVCREGWNGKGMWLMLQLGTTVPKDFIPKFASLNQAAKDKLQGIDKDVVFNPNIALFNASGEFQPGWNASQPDMLATDWQVL